MTTDEMDAEIGRAFRERRELAKKIDCLRLRLRTVGTAASTLAENPLHAESEQVMSDASDVREDFKALRAALTRIADLDKVLS